MLLRHFNTGKILAISPNNLPYLQDFKEHIIKEEASRSSLTPKKALLKNDQSIISKLSAKLGVNAEKESSRQSFQDGVSVGAPRSSSGSDPKSDNEGDEEEDLFGFKIDDDKESGLDDEVDSFAKDKSSKNENSIKDSSGNERSKTNPVKSEERLIESSDKASTNGLKAKPRIIEEQAKSRHVVTMHEGSGELDSPLYKKMDLEAKRIKIIEEESLEANDPPIIRKPFRSS